MKKAFLFLIQTVILVVLLTGCVVDSKNLQVSILTDQGEHDFVVQVAESFDERLRGLQQVTDLSDNEGMWFVFDEPKVLSFWMKDTLIPLDIIFVNEDFEVINVAHKAEPCTESDPEQLNCESYFSDNPAQYVLEIKGGLASELGIVAGDKITLTK